MQISTSFPLADTIDRAFYILHGEGADDENCEAFASHWGGLDIEHFQRALEAGTGEEQVLAIFALGLTSTAETAEHIAPFLWRAPRMQRWASALCLGLMHDARAFPALENLLLDGLDLEAYTQALQKNEEDVLFELRWCQRFRWSVIQLLENWETPPPSLLPTMKQAFAVLWHMQQHLPPFECILANYDALAYALGQRRDFTLFHNLAVPPAHRVTAMVYLALGYLHVNVPGNSLLSGQSYYPLELLHALHRSKSLQQQVTEVLTSHFALSQEEQDNWLNYVPEYTDAREQYGSSYPGTAGENEIEGEAEDEDEGEMIRPLPLCIYRDHPADVKSLSWSPDNTALVSGSEDGTARVWKIATGETMTLFRGHTASINLVAWSPQRHLIVSGGSDRLVCVWDAWSGELLNTYRGHQAWIWGGLAWSPDGTKIASASLDRTIQVWDALLGEPLLIYRGHTGIVTSLAWSPDGRCIVSGGGYPECAVQIWDTRSGALQLTYRDHQRDEHRPLLSPPDHPSLRNWLQGPSSVHGLAWSPDGMSIASAGLRYVCRVWDASSGKNVIASDRTIGPVAWSPDGLFVLSPTSGGVLECWSATTNRLAVSYKLQKMYEINTGIWSPNGKLLAAIGRDPAASGKQAVQVWNATP